MTISTNGIQVHMNSFVKQPSDQLPKLPRHTIHISHYFAISDDDDDTWRPDGHPHISDYVVSDVRNAMLGAIVAFFCSLNDSRQTRDGIWEGGLKGLILFSHPSKH